VIGDEVLEFVKMHAPCKIMIEAPAYMPTMRSQMIQLGELAGVVKNKLLEAGYTWDLVHNNTLKAFATGNGRAGKPAMYHAARALWPECPTIDDIADAFHLARYAVA
jgi:Holliday junction resolvasome RuvABC endonuclease subunit